MGATKGRGKRRPTHVEPEVAYLWGVAKAQGLTVTSLARRMAGGKSPAVTVTGKILKGTRGCTVETLRKMAAAVGLRITFEAVAEEAEVEAEHYEWVNALVDGGGELSISYRLKGAAHSNSQVHDEDVSGWTDDAVKKVVRSTLAIDEDDPVEIELEREHDGEDDDDLEDDSQLDYEDDD